jgi:hypothetical protein
VYYFNLNGIWWMGLFDRFLDGFTGLLYRLDFFCLDYTLSEVGSLPILGYNRRQETSARICKPFKEPKESIPNLAGQDNNPI